MLCFSSMCWKKSFVPVKEIDFHVHRGVSFHIKDAEMWFWLWLLHCRPTEMMFLVAVSDIWNCLNNKMSWQTNRQANTQQINYLLVGYSSTMTWPYGSQSLPYLSCQCRVIVVYTDEIMKGHYFPPLYCHRYVSQFHCKDIQLKSENMAFGLEVTAPRGSMLTIISCINVCQWNKYTSLC